jgi:probable phosphoglycerate mutase
MENEPQRVVLVRHGETEWSRAHRHTGRTDLPLTSEGRAAATKLRPLLHHRSFALVLTSPLRRARTSCELAGFGDVAQVRDDLLELRLV